MDHDRFHILSLRLYVLGKASPHVLSPLWDCHLWGNPSSHEKSMHEERDARAEMYVKTTSHGSSPNHHLTKTIWQTLSKHCPLELSQPTELWVMMIICFKTLVCLTAKDKESRYHLCLTILRCHRILFVAFWLDLFRT